MRSCQSGDRLTSFHQLDASVSFKATTMTAASDDGVSPPALLLPSIPIPILRFHQSINQSIQSNQWILSTTAREILENGLDSITKPQSDDNLFSSLLSSPPLPSSQNLLFCFLFCFIIVFFFFFCEPIKQNKIK
ncbi:hypothetical protein TorRG33x02_283310 [Trema orientale]|uniref:Uncharacterized protein n=1 Tax=Trema orientale TaxID=63057 RepID=A0A2P5CIN2_TREOI|nr:hypothetical protein TorRG33x02_283310 [Trema orientale]